MPSTTRSQSTDRLSTVPQHTEPLSPRFESNPTTESIERLTQLVATLAQNQIQTQLLFQSQSQTPATPNTFRLPKYNGTGDVELFIQQFNEVAQANEWNNAAALLFLKEALIEKAQECRRPRDVEGVLAALRGCFGISPREARSRLAQLRKNPRTTLLEHSTEVSQLVDIGFANLDHQQRHSMKMETFSTTLCNPALQTHLLAMAPYNMAAAVSAGNDFLSINAKNRFNIRQTDTSPEDPDYPSVMAVTPDPSHKLFETMLQSIQKLATEVAQLRSPLPSPPQPLMNHRPPSPLDLNNRPPPKCWNCGQLGHLRRFCKVTPPTPTRSENY